MKRTAAWILFLVSSAQLATAAGWPQYRGPSRHGTATAAADLLDNWGDAGPVELWRVDVGAGYSGVSISAGTVYLMAVDQDQEIVFALDAATGEESWRRAVGPIAQSDMDDNGPRSTPTIVEGRVYTASSSGRLVALEATDGTLVWERDLLAGGKAPRFGYSTSPLVDGALVIVESGASEEVPGVEAYDRATGELAWSALEGPAGYSSPIAIELAGERQIIFFRRAKAEVVSLSTAGGVLWRHPTEALAIITTPIFLPPNRLFVASADDVFGGLMLEVEKGADGYRVREVWSERLMRNHFNTAVAVEGHLYGFDNGTLRCLDATTGAKLWAKRGFGKGSLIAAGNRLYVLSDSGTLALVEATPEGFHEHGRFRAMSGRAWTAPSYSDGNLFVRDFDELAAFDLRRLAAPEAAATEEVLP